MTRPVYLDNAATTPVRPEVRDAMLPYLSEEAFGNPSSAHQFGRTARAGIDRAKRQIAAALDAEPNQVIFTSGGTEADNLAVVGGALAARTQGGGRPFRVAVSAIEHKAVLAAATAVERLGGEAIILPVDACGQVELPAVDDALERGVAVLSAMWVNNEVGVIQDVIRLANRCLDANVPFHTDAVQAVGKVACSMAGWPCTLMAISAHKIGGPKGAGALIVRDPKAVEAIIHGGEQQFGIRPGTENVAGIVGLGQAVEMAVRERETTAKHLADLRDGFERRVLEIAPDATIILRDGNRAPHISSVAIPGIDPEALVMHCDLAGVACSTGSACNTGLVEPSHVLKAIGIPIDLASRVVRFSFYRQNTADDVDRAIEVLPEIISNVRKLSAALAI